MRGHSTRLPPTFKPSYGSKKIFSEGEATMKGLTSEEQAALQKFSAEALINAETQRFRVDPNMCYLPKDVRAQDPAFWMPKKPVTKTPSTQQH